MKNKLYIACLVGILLSILVLSFKAGANMKKTYLFMQLAPYGTIEKAEKDAYLITLKNIMPAVIFFSDRPNRDTGNVSIDKFLEIWQYNGTDNLKLDPPNASLSAFNPIQNETLNIVVELSDPQYYRNSNNFTYMAKILRGSDQLANHETIVKDISLSIDDVCLSCW